MEAVLIPRRLHRVTEVATFKIGASLYIITESPPPGAPHAFELLCNGQTIAVCQSAKALSDWAFRHGASEVRHDYDLILSDGEA
jgi:hypothetical protein